MQLHQPTGLPAAARLLIGRKRAVSGYSENAYNLDDLCNQLGDLGVETFGSGSYGIVVAHPDPNKAVKVSLSEDDPYRDYIELAMEYQFAWMPVVYSVRHWRRGAFVVLMERLYEQYNRDWREDLEGAREWLADHRPRHARCDLSGCNVMQRLDGTLVVTDPWAHDEY